MNSTSTSFHQFNRLRSIVSESVTLMVYRVSSWHRSAHEYHGFIPAQDFAAFRARELRV